MPKQKSEWTPYGLEAIRAGHLRKRRIMAALLMLGILATWMVFFQGTAERSLSISVNGEEVDSPIRIDEPERDDAPDHVTVALSPGAVTRLETGGDGPTSEVTRSSTPSFSRAAPYPWLLWIMNLGPWLLLGSAAWLLGKRRGKHDEVNYGIYKGAMPFEMITAANQRSVFTKRFTVRSVFGKGRADHVPSEVPTSEDAETEA